MSETICAVAEDTSMSTFSNWHSYHLYYHADRKLAVKELVWPTVVSLLAEGSVESFFFIYYPLGGPHLRLRLWIPPEHRDRVDETLERAAAGFLERRPSTDSFEIATLEEANPRILANAPVERDAQIYPDNTFRRASFHPEVERYGGVELLAHSHDFFAHSSVLALRHLAEHGDKPASQQLPHCFRLLARHGLTLADSVQELLPLLRSRTGPAGRFRESVLAKANAVFERDGNVLTAIFQEEVETLLAGGFEGGSGIFIEASQRLAREIAGADSDTRWRIKSSHMHMTSNRLGFLNPEEAYLSQLMWSSASRLLAARPELEDRLDRHYGQRQSLPLRRLETLRQLAFRELIAASASAGGGVPIPLQNQAFETIDPTPAT